MKRDDSIIDSNTRTNKFIKPPRLPDIMSIDLWVRSKDAELLTGIVADIRLSEHGNAILTGSLENTGLLSKIRSAFVLGKEGLWVPEGESPDKGTRFVYIKNSLAYRGGLILTPYSDVDVRSHLNGTTIDQRTDIYRVELLGREDEDFECRVFRTYYHTTELVKRLNERNEHLLLYNSNGQSNQP